MDLSGELAKTLLDLAPDATIVVDAHGTIVFANAQIEQTFGYRAEEIVGLSIEALLPERFRAAHPKHRERFATQPKPRPMGAGLALYGHHKDGHEFPVEISLSPVTTPSGPLVVGAIRDATITHDRQVQLVEENRQKSHFLAAASHDLRQPLQTLNLLNRAAQRLAGSNAGLIALLERQQLALDSMAALLASVLDISKLDSGAVEVRPAACSIDEVFARLRSDFEPQAADRGIDLTIERSTETAFTDAELLRRLLANLVSNAIRYTQAGGIHVACVAHGGKLQIEVRDTGIGIPSDQLERVFEEFYQVDRGTQRPEGLGLGLSIVRRLANILRCDIKLESTVGKGTTFHVDVDRSVQKEGAVERTASVELANTGRVLIVDDERAVADATCLLLELEGYEVSIASSEREALKRVSANPPDLIVSDFHLRGGETGVGVVTSVRSRVGHAIPVVFVTGDTAKAALAHSKIDNAVLLNKPVRADDLLAAVRESIAPRRDHSTG
ncbi:MAG TPA: ATP-binding protein [Kofleriaceae bacterium]|jgi:PAS domain S-box-containing protein|nr:ATP-binding protein [Kofleriaceae bacterium]